MKKILLLLCFMVFLCISAYSLTQQEYVQSLGIDYIKGSSFDELNNSFKENYVDISLMNITYTLLPTNVSKVDLFIGNLNSNLIVYDYILKIFTTNDVLEKKIDYIDSSALNYSFTFENTTFLGISILPEYNNYELDLRNNIYQYNSSFFNDSYVNESILDTTLFWNFTYNNISDILPLNLDLNWYDGDILNFSNDNITLYFSNKNTLMGDYRFMLKADDEAEFFINNISYLKTRKKGNPYFSDKITLLGNQTFNLNYTEKYNNAELSFSYYSVCPQIFTMLNNWSYLSCDYNRDIFLDSYVLDSNLSLAFDLGTSLLSSLFPKQDLVFTKKHYFEKGEYEINFQSQNNARLYINDNFVNTVKNLIPSISKINGDGGLVYKKLSFDEGEYNITIKLPPSGGRKYVFFDFKKIEVGHGGFERFPYTFDIKISKETADMMSNYPETNWNMVAQESFDDFLMKK